MVSGVQNLPGCIATVKLFSVKFWVFVTEGFIYYDLNKAGLFVNIFKILQRTLKPEKITGAYLYHVWITGKVSSFLALRI